MEGFTVDTRAEDLRHVWIPLTLKMSISKSQGLEISSWPEGEEVRGSTRRRERERERNGTFSVSSRLKRLPCVQLSAAEEADGAALYDLVVTVPHVLDARTGGNLVAHIKVGETYHQRKEVRLEWRLSAGGARSPDVSSRDGFIPPSPAGRHAPAVVPLQRLPHRAHRQGDHYDASGATRCRLSPSHQTVFSPLLLSQTEAAQFDVSWKVPAILYYAKRNYHTRYDLRSRSSLVHTVPFSSLVIAASADASCCASQLKTP